MWYGNTCKTRSKASEFVQAMRLGPRKKADETENKYYSRKKNLLWSTAMNLRWPLLWFPRSFPLWVLTTSLPWNQEAQEDSENFIYLGTFSSRWFFYLSTGWTKYPSYSLFLDKVAFKHYSHHCHFHLRLPLTHTMKIKWDWEWLMLLFLMMNATNFVSFGKFSYSFSLLT